MRKIIGRIRKAINDYDMIKDGDKIAVGLSGGKDSCALLTALALYRKYSPEKFDLIGINIDMGFNDINQDEVAALKAHCESLDVPLIIEKTNIAEIIFDIRKEKSPCSLCSKMRRGALCNVAKANGANKVALGHHSNDVLETMMLSFGYESRLSSFMPVTYLSKTDITVIRPMIYVEEGDIRGAAKRLNLPIVHNPCPQDKHTEREYMKKLIDKINEDIPHARDRMTTAIMRPEAYNLWDKVKK